MSKARPRGPSGLGAGTVFGSVPARVITVMYSFADERALAQDRVATRRVRVRRPWENPPRWSVPDFIDTDLGCQVG